MLVLLQHKAGRVGMPLNGKKTLVTGGSRGIGFQISKIFLENGASVLAVSRDTAKLAQAKDALPDLHILQADVSIAIDNDRVAAWIQDNWGMLDILVNNAGVSTSIIGSLSNIPDEEFEQIMRTNVSGPYLCTKHLLPLLLQSDDPRIVNVGSTSGVMSSSLSGVYGVSKVALHALTIATANELRGKVAVNALSPGWVRTDMAPDAPGNPRTSAESALWLTTQPNKLTGKLFHGKAEIGWSSQS